MARQKRLRAVDEYLKPMSDNANDERIFGALRAMEAKGLVTIVERAN